MAENLYEARQVVGKRDDGSLLAVDFRGREESPREANGGEDPSSYSVPSPLRWINLEVIVRRVLPVFCLE